MDAIQATRETLGLVHEYLEAAIGDCQPQTLAHTFPGATIGSIYSIYVHAVDYDRGGEWAGSNFMCSADKSFAIRGVQDCPKRGYKRTGFFEVDTGEAQEWTVRLTDPDNKEANGQ